MELCIVELARRHLDPVAAMHICAQTSFIHDPENYCSGEFHFYRDKVQLFFDLEPQGTHVAVAGDRVMGFLMGTYDLPVFKNRARKNWSHIRFGLSFLTFRYGMSAEMIQRFLRLPQVMSEKDAGLEIPPGNLWSIIVSEDARGHSLAGRLMKAHCSYVKSRGGTRTHALVAADNELAIPVYKKEGWKIIGQMPASNGVNEVFVREL